MDGLPASPGGPRVAAERLAEEMREETERMLAGVMAAVNAAPDGAWIDASEMAVRDLLGEYRRRVYERALQLRADAAEGAFSPGGPGGPVHGRATQGQGPLAAQQPDGQRPGEPLAHALPRAARRQRHPVGRAGGCGRGDGEPRGA